MKLITEESGQTTPDMDRNLKEFREFQTTETQKTIERDVAALGIKNWKDVLDFQRRNFSIKNFREASYGAHRKMKLHEAQAELSFGQLLRAGVMNTFNDLYQAVEVVYPALVRESASNKRQEFYAPLERAGFPKRVERQGNFPETNFKGLDIEIINVKWGMMLSFERELLDDDMTGQVIQRASDAGVNSRIFEEAYVLNRLFNKSGASLDGEPLPVSQTYSTVYSTSGIHTGGYGINATTAARISQSSLQAGWILAKKMLDQSGRPFVVTPKYLAVSPQDIFFAEILLNSDYNPSKASSATGDDGKVGGGFSVNPIKNLVAVVSSRFVPDYGALLADPKGFAFQRRDPTEVVQENPQSGPAFSQEVFRYKQRSRWEADFIDPKFYINLNTSFAST
jgi:hypothetical protein